MGQVWNVWCHPRRTARELQNYIDLYCDTSDSLAKSEQTAAELSETVSCLSDELRAATESRDTYKLLSESLSAQVEALTADAKSLSAQVEALTVRLSEYSEIDAAMHQFEATLSRAEQMKQQYETRIARLRAKIIELKSCLRPDLNPDARSVPIPPISAATPSPTPTQPPPLTPIDMTDSLSHPDTEWLSLLPD